MSDPSERLRQFAANVPDSGTSLLACTGDPYRSSLTIHTVEQEMREAVAFLKSWERHKPIIAGGALWSWAAGERARDVDIFVRRSWWTARKARKASRFNGTDQVSNIPRIDNYFGVLDEVTRYVTRLPSGTPVDLILTPWRGLDNLRRFDYEHCRVSFGGYLDLCSSWGAGTYANGDLVQMHYFSCRPKNVVQSKVQPSLWGHKTAAERLYVTMTRLREMYQEL